MTHWPPLLARGQGATTFVALPDLPTIRRAVFTAGLSFEEDGPWLDDALVRPVVVSRGACESLALPSSALLNRFPRGGSCWLLVRAATGVLVARARVTI